LPSGGASRQIGLGDKMAGIKDIYRMTAPLGYKDAGEVGVREKIKDWISNARENWFAPKQYEGGDDPEYMKLFNFFWEKGYTQQQIDDIINGKVDPTEIVPLRENLDERFKG
tara:strand:+ start:375 stop:710 length:336 start_codon:yes stop_codon:yes gene_type:complete